MRWSKKKSRRQSSMTEKKVAAAITWEIYFNKRVEKIDLKDAN